MSNQYLFYQPIVNNSSFRAFPSPIPVKTPQTQLGEVVSRKNNEFRDCNHAFLKNYVILLDNTHREGYNIVAKDGDEYETIRNE
jgi:hypothetical protein